MWPEVMFDISLTLFFYRDCWQWRDAIQRWSFQAWYCYTWEVQYACPVAAYRVFLTKLLIVKVCCCSSIAFCFMCYFILKLIFHSACKQAVKANIKIVWFHCENVWIWLKTIRLMVVLADGICNWWIKFEKWKIEHFTKPSFKVWWCGGI